MKVILACLLALDYHLFLVQIVPISEAEEKTVSTVFHHPTRLNSIANVMTLLGVRIRDDYAFMEEPHACITVMKQANLSRLLAIETSQAYEFFRFQEVALILSTISREFETCAIVISAIKIDLYLAVLWT